MAQHPLFEALPSGTGDRLPAGLHAAVFGSLPTTTARELDVPEVATAVRALLARRWRPAQLAARVGALPAAADPVAAVVTFLTALRERDSPQQAWEAERKERERSSAEQGPPPASDAVRAHWAAQARAQLARSGAGSRLLPRPVAVRPAPAAPSCATCDGPGELFVTREVRLCTACVGVLRTGTACLSARAQAG